MRRLVDSGWHKPREKSADKFGDEFHPRNTGIDEGVCQQQRALFDRLGIAGKSLTRLNQVHESQERRGLFKTGKIGQGLGIPDFHRANRLHNPYINI